MLVMKSLVFIKPRSQRRCAFQTTAHTASGLQQSPGDSIAWLLPPKVLSCLAPAGVIASSRGTRGPQARRIISMERVRHFTLSSGHLARYTFIRCPGVIAFQISQSAGLTLWDSRCFARRGSLHSLGGLSAGREVAQARLPAWHAHLQACCCRHSDHISRCIHGNAQ